MSDILGPNVGYVDILFHEMNEMATTEAADPEYKKKYTPLRPSAAGKCSRELYHEFQSYSGKEFTPAEPMKPETKLLLDLGHSIEYHILKHFRKAMPAWDIKMLYGQQTLSFVNLDDVEDPSLSQWIEGKLDLTFISDDWKCVADIKSKKDRFSFIHKTNWDETDEKLRNMESVISIGDKGTSYWVENLEDFLDELNDSFFEANFLQLNLYANSQFLKERGVDHAAIIQYCKNDSRLREVRFKPCAKTYKKVIDKFKSVQKAVDQGNIDMAPKDFILGSMKCGFCDYKGKCWPREEPLKEWFRTLPKKSWPARVTSMSPGIRKDFMNYFKKYDVASSIKAEEKKTESDLSKFMHDNKLWKVELEDGRIFRIKDLKDGLVIRRTKK